MADVTYEKISLGRVKGDEGKSAYQSWLDSGNTGSEEDFVEWLKGDTGAKIVSTEFIGTDENGGNRYLQTFDNGVTAEFVAPKGKNGSVEIVTVDYQDLAGQQQLDRFTELTQRYLDGEIVIHLVHSTLDPRPVTSVVTEVYKSGDVIYWTSVSWDEDTDTLSTFKIGKKDGKITWSGSLLKIDDVIHKDEFPDLPDKVVLPDTSKQKWRDMIGAISNTDAVKKYTSSKGAMIAYGRDGELNETVYKVSHNAVANNIVMWTSNTYGDEDSGGNATIILPIPTRPYHGANKNYVDNLPDYLTLSPEQKAKWQDMIGADNTESVNNVFFLKVADGFFETYEIFRNRGIRFAPDQYMDKGAYRYFAPLDISENPNVNYSELELGYKYLFSHPTYGKEILVADYYPDSITNTIFLRGRSDGAYAKFYNKVFRGLWDMPIVEKISINPIASHNIHIISDTSAEQFSVISFQFTNSNPNPMTYSEISSYLQQIGFGNIDITTGKGSLMASGNVYNTVSKKCYQAFGVYGAGENGYLTAFYYNVDEGKVDFKTLDEDKITLTDTVINS